MTGIGIDSDSVLQFALDHDRIVRLAAATGAFVAAGSPVIELSGSDAPTQDDARHLRNWAKPGAPAHGGAGRGIRPAAAGRWGARGAVARHQRPDHRLHVHRPARRALGRLASRRFPDPHRIARGRLRVIALAPDFAAIVKLALDPIVAHSRADLQVLGRMLDALGFVAQATLDPQRHASLANATRNVYRELCRIEPLIRSAPARRRARLLERSLRSASAG